MTDTLIAVAWGSVIVLVVLVSAVAICRVGADAYAHREQLWREREIRRGHVK